GGGVSCVDRGRVAGRGVLGCSAVAGGGAGGGACVLRVVTLVFIAATAMGLRVPSQLDHVGPKPAKGDPAQAVTVPTAGPPGAGGHPGRGPGGTVPLEAGSARAGAPGAKARPSVRPGLRTLRHVGPVVAEAMRANATLRAFSGF